MELAALRESMRKLAPAAAAGPGRAGQTLSTGFDALDRQLRGEGIPRGRLTEVAGAPSSGKTALALTALAEQTRSGALVAFVDARGGFYPPAAAAHGVELSRLLVVRMPTREASTVPTPGDAVRAAEILAFSRAFPLIAITLPADAGLTLAQGRRLRAAAQRCGVALLLLADRSGIADGVAARVEVEPARSPETGRRITAIVTKGSTSGGPARAELSLASIRIDDAPPVALLAPTKRATPGAAGGHP